MKYTREELEKIIREKYKTGDKIFADTYDVEGVIKDIEKIRIYKSLKKVSVPCHTKYGLLSLFLYSEEVWTDEGKYETRFAEILEKALVTNEQNI